MQNKTLQMKRAMRTALLVLLLSAAGMGKLSAQNLRFDFEQCNVGDKVAETLGEPWTTWNQTPGSAEDAVVSDEYSHGSRALKIDNGNDAVLRLGDKTTGSYSISLDLFIPEGKEAYFNILHEFAGSNSVWATQVWLKSESYGNHVWPGTIDPFDVPFDEWFTIGFDIYLDDALVCMKVGDRIIGAWDYSRYTTAKYCGIAAMNFYPSSSDANKNGFFIDDITFEEITGPFSINLNPESESLEIINDANRLDTLRSGFANEGDRIAKYRTWIDYGIGEEGGEEKVLHHDGEPRYTYGSYDNDPYIEIGSRFLIDYLNDNSFMGRKITKMQYYVPYSASDGCSGPLTFRIYRFYDKQLLAEKQLGTYSFGAWNSVEFDEPIPLRGFDIFATVGFQQVNGGYPISLDAGPALTYIADLVRLDGGDWFSLNSNSIYYGGQEWGNHNIRLICEGHAVESNWVKQTWLPDGYYGFATTYLCPGQVADIDLVFDSNELAYGLYEANLKIATINNYDNIEVSVPIKMKVSGTNVDDITVEKSKIYPNPTNGQIIIEAESLRHITISNLLGQTIFDGNASGDEFNYDFCKHDAGIYLIRIETASGVAVKKVSVTR